MPPCKKVYRIVINSNDRLYLDNLHSHSDNYYNINVASLQLETGCKYQMAIESFTSDTTDGLNAFMFNIMSVGQPDSYYSSTKGPNFCLYVAKTWSYNRPINFDSIGCPMGNIEWLRSGCIQIKLTYLYDNVQFNYHWAAVLCIWEMPDKIV